MKNILNWKTLAVLTAAILVFGAGAVFGSHHHKPSSVIHVVTIDWNEGADSAAALAGVDKLGESYEGVTRVWTRSIKAQGRQAAFVMEFKDEQALKDYAGSDAQKEWYKTYEGARATSRTFDITN
jgi:hypothetical protein